MTYLKVINFFCVFMLMFLIIGVSGCKKNEIPPDGELMNFGTCKQNMESTDAISKMSHQDNSVECIEYTYSEETRILIIKHINAGFNCCPGEISAEFEIDNNLITVKENEKEAGCHCLCLYDLNLKIINLNPGNYHFIIKTPYTDGNPEQSFECDLNLTTSVTDSYCVPRRTYPWNI